MTKFICVAWMLCGMAATLVAQNKNYFFIKGIVAEQGTSIAVPFASIRISHTNDGTAAGPDGHFQLKIEQSHSNERLEISCIGFTTRILKLDSIEKLNTSVIHISLQPAVSLLNEVVIGEKVINPVMLVNAAIAGIPKNYYPKPFNITYYSKIKASDTINHKNYQLESILSGFYKGYAVNEGKRFNILQIREHGTDPYENDKNMKGTWWPTLEIHNADGIMSPFSSGLLHPGNLKEFELKYAGIALYEQDTVYKIQYFAPKPSKKNTGYGIVPKFYKGTIYITTSTHAVVYHEIDASAFRFRIIYKKEGGYYFPYYVDGTRTLQVHTAHDILFVKVANQIIRTQLNMDHPIELPKQDETTIRGITFNETFWEQNYPEDL